MIVALASPHVATSLDDGLARIERLVAEAASQHAQIICFPEAYLPGLRGQDFEVIPWDAEQESRAHARTPEGSGVSVPAPAAVRGPAAGPRSGP